MNITSIIRLYKKRWIAILIVTFIGTAAALGIALTRDPSTHEATLFLSIGTKQINSSSSTFDDVQAADRFTETLQGWFKNPDLIKRIEEKTGESVSLSARKQEKQNLIVTLPAMSEEMADTIANITIQELKQDIQQYNASTGSQYTLALASVTIEEQKAKTLIFGLIGFVFGIVFALGLVHAWEFIRKAT